MSTLIELREKLEKSWGKDTCYYGGNYEEEDPAYGQCAITALIVQRDFGGDIVRGNVRTPYGKVFTHYWNAINGIDIDLTWRQFPAGSNVGPTKVVNRATLLKSGSVKMRYVLLFNKIY